MFELISESGLYGFLTILFTILLIAAFIVLIFRFESRKALYIFAAVSVLPLLFGLTGTALGYNKVDRMVQKEKVEVAQKTIEDGRAQARVTTYMGAFGTLILWILAGIAILFTSNGESKVEERKDFNTRKE